MQASLRDVGTLSIACHDAQNRKLATTSDYDPNQSRRGRRRETQPWVMLSLSALLSTMSSEFPAPNHDQQADSVAAQFLQSQKLLHQCSRPAFTSIAHGQF
ncbi:hypothetical protein, variant [Phialophora macrospora]|uniref:Uncharacterized protein n=1 Tax=Phialophora macrospora TaxID=1851006 RepID=A0A0D2GI42_9EURO|nr:hypothetical protein PV04_00208 [Phialophora macrospora]KIW71984.1 hypothetical protein, variant [Phialophora macrospora]